MAKSADILHVRMTRFLLLFFFIINPISFAFAQECCTNRWWQKENPTPGYNQQYNPDYLSIKRDLEIKCDHFRDFIQVTSNIIKDSGRPADHVTLRAIADSEREIRRLEHELSQIPILIEKVTFHIDEYENDPNEFYPPKDQNQYRNEVYYTPIEEEYFIYPDSVSIKEFNGSTADTIIIDQ